MAGDGALRRAAVVAATVFLLVAGVASAARPGRFQLTHPVRWLAVLVVVVGAVVLVVAAVALLLRRPVPAKAVRAGRAAERTPFDPRLLLILPFLALMVWALTKLHVSYPPRQPPPASAAAAPPHGGVPGGASGSGLDIGPWVVLALGLLLVLVVTAVAVHSLRARRDVEAAGVRRSADDPLAAAVEAALIDLEGEEDPRRAVIKAYARTEAVLRDHGLPRRPAEAPLEYLDRVLRELGAGGAAVDRLTELFEQAAFSRHDIGQDMRAEAVAAFHGLRDSLTSAEAL